MNPLLRSHKLLTCSLATFLAAMAAFFVRFFLPENGSLLLFLLCPYYALVFAVGFSGSLDAFLNQTLPVFEVIAYGLVASRGWLRGKLVSALVCLTVAHLLALAVGYAIVFLLPRT
jgi:hypothetical protein